MATHVGVGFSKNPNAFTAASEATEEATSQIEGGRIDFAFFCHTMHYSPQDFLPILYKGLDQTKLLGTSTAAILLPKSIEMQGIGVLAIQSDEIRFETGRINHLNLQNIYEAGRILAHNTISEYGQQSRKFFFLITESYLPNTDNLLAGVREQFGQFLPIWGVGTCDNFLFESGFQYYHNEILSKGASGVLVGGKPKLAASFRHGFSPLGKPRILDEVKHNIIRKIDNKKAISIYEEYFQEEALTIKANRLNHINIRYPLGIKSSEKKEYLLRNVIDILEDGSLVCQNKIENFLEVHIMIANNEAYLNAAKQAALDVKRQLEGQKPHFILIIESLMRHKLLGKAHIKQMQIIQEVLGDKTPLLGLYSLGEIVTLPINQTTSQSFYQNSGITILAVA